MSLAIVLVITVQALVIVLLLWHMLRRRRLSGLAISERQAGCAHAGEAVWTLANGQRTFSGAGRQQGARIVLGGAQFLGAQQRVEFDCSARSNTLAAAPQLALCIPARVLPPVSKRRS